MGRSVTTSNDSAFITVPTATGFTAGEFVYNQSSGYGRIANNAVSTATFPIGASGCEVLYSDTNNQAQMVWADYTGCAEYTNGAAAKLTNGNIVIPYAPNVVQNTSTYPYFKIVDSTGAVVVAGTQVDAVNNLVPVYTPVLGALALPNGNFVIYYRASVSGTFRLVFRVYNSAGVAQTAVIPVTAITLTSGNAVDLYAAARSDSSFVIVGVNNGNTPFYSVFNGSTGATVYSGTWGSSTTVLGRMAVVVRSDNSWVMVQYSNNTGNVHWEVRSATNVQSAASSYYSGYTQSVTAVLLTGDVVAILGYTTSAIGINLLTGTTMGSETQLVSSSGHLFLPTISAYSFDSGTKFLVTCNAASIAGTTNGKAVAYLVFSSGLALLSSGTAPLPLGMFSSATTQFSFVEVGNTIRCYKSARPVSTTSSTSVMSGAGVVYAAIDKTTLLPINQQSAVYSLGTSSALAVSGYAQSVSTPSRAYFYAASTSTQSVALTQRQVLIPQTVVESTACNSTQVVALSGGQFAYLYKYTASPYTIKLAIYNSSGTQTNIVTVDTGADAENGARMALLSSGKLMVIYTQGSSLKFKVYSLALAVLTSGTIGATVSNTTNACISISPLGVAGRAVIGYRDDSYYARYAVCEDTGTVVTTNTVSTFSINAISVCGTRTGSFITSSCESGNYWRIASYYLSGTNTYTQLNVLGLGSGTNPIVGLHLEPSPDNAAIFCYSSSSTLGLGTVDGGSLYLNSNYGWKYGYGPNNTTTTVGIGCTANNMYVVFTSRYNTTDSNPYYQVFSPSGQNNILVNDTAITGLSVPASASSCPSITPFVGDTCLLSVLNASNYPTFYAFAPYASTQYGVITGGSSVSNPVTLSPATRFSLVGVAVTTATAGGTGVIQTKGNVQINNGYQSFSTQSFDFRNPTTLGVSGTVTGRIVTLEA